MKKSSAVVFQAALVCCISPPLPPQRDSPCEKQIRRDLARTFPDHDFFKEKDSLGQEALFNVMKVSQVNYGICRVVWTAVAS